MFDVSSEKFKTIKIKFFDGKDEEYKFTAILPKERSEIAVKRVYLQGGMAADAFTMVDMKNFNEIATVDTCLVKGPDRLDKYDSCREWDDPGLITDIYDKIIELSNEIERKLKKNRSSSGSA